MSLHDRHGHTVITNAVTTLVRRRRAERVGALVGGPGAGDVGCG
jgi:hypothetical protein